MEKVTKQDIEKRCAELEASGELQAFFDELNNSMSCSRRCPPIYNSGFCDDDVDCNACWEEYRASLRQCRHRVRDCEGCQFKEARRWISPYKPANYHRVGVPHVYAHCRKHGKRCSEIRYCEDYCR